MPSDTRSKEERELMPDHPLRHKPKRKYIRKPKTGKPLQSEWEDVSRTVFNNLQELLSQRDDDGRLMCTPALLTAASKLIIESETVYKQPPSEEVDRLSAQLKEKRDKRSLRSVPSDRFKFTNEKNLPTACDEDPLTQLRGKTIHNNGKIG